MLSTSTKGNIGQYYTCANLTERGYVVLLPSGNHPHYDLVIEKDGIFKRVQVKYANIKNNILGVKLYTTDGSGKQNSHLLKDVDIFAIYEPVNKQIYYIKLEDFPNNKTRISLRMNNPKNNQQTKIRFGKDYLMI